MSPPEIIAPPVRMKAPLLVSSSSVWKVLSRNPSPVRAICPPLDMTSGSADSKRSDLGGPPG